MPTSPTRTARSAQDTRAAVHRAATDLFSRHGYTATGVRDIAARAGVDPALVIRYFGSKEKLFLDTMTMRDAFAPIADEPADRFGAALVGFLVDRVRDESGNTHVFTALLRASDLPAVRDRLRQQISEMVDRVLAPRLRGPDLALRSRLIGAQVTGLLTALCVLDDPVLTAAPREQLVEHYGRAIQELVDS